jgi:hypothetical protein
MQENFPRVGESERLMEFIETGTQEIKITLKLKPAQKPFDLHNQTNCEMLKYFFEKQGYTFKRFDVAQTRG